jgi:hypothetical protein
VARERDDLMTNPGLAQSRRRTDGHGTWSDAPRRTRALSSNRAGTSSTRGNMGSNAHQLPGGRSLQGSIQAPDGPGFQDAVHRPGRRPRLTGVSVAGNRITFMPSGVCVTGGTYIWKVKGRTLTFARVRDACRKRAIQLVRQWTRVG